MLSTVWKPFVQFFRLGGLSIVPTAKNFTRPSVTEYPNSPGFLARTTPRQEAQGLENEPEVHRRLEDAPSLGKLMCAGVAASSRPACSRWQQGDPNMCGFAGHAFDLSRDQGICRSSSRTSAVGLPRSFRVQRLPAGSQRAQPSAARAPSLARQGMVNTLFDTCGRRRSSTKLKLLFEQQRRRLS